MVTFLFLFFNMFQVSACVISHMKMQQKVSEVMGGVVELQSYIKVHATDFEGTLESGPNQVTSEIAWDQVGEFGGDS